MMSYCKKCGVELDESMVFCPLCGHPANEEADKEPIKDHAELELYAHYEKLTKSQKRKIFWELSGLILLSGIIVTFIIDLIINQRITWSKYSITISLVLLVNTTLITFLRNRLFLLSTISFLSTSALLVLLDWYNMNIGWGIRLGIPFLFSFYVLLLLFVIITKSLKRKGFNLLAYVFIIIGIFSMCIEGIIAFYADHAITLHWSVIVMVCVLPIAAILMFMHYRLKKGIDLKRFFHI